MRRACFSQLGEKLNRMYTGLSEEIKSSDIVTNLKKVLLIRNEQEVQLTAAVRLYKESRDLKTHKKIQALIQQLSGNFDVIDISGPSSSKSNRIQPKNLTSPSETGDLI